MKRLSFSVVLPFWETVRIKLGPKRVDFLSWLLPRAQRQPPDLRMHEKGGSIKEPAKKSSDRFIFAVSSF